MEINDFLGRLEKVKRRGNGWIARCPSHEDRVSSLSITEGENGAILLFCHAGCSYHSIMGQLGLHPSEGMGDRGDGMGEPEAVYPYHDENGNLLYEVCRLPGKQFRARLADGTWSIKDARKVIYHLPEVLAAKDTQWIYVVEGEKDADAILSYGGVATCNPFGAGGWKDSYSVWLASAKVLVVADRDATGMEHARSVAASLEGIAKEVRIVQAAEGKDASDHLGLGYALDEFVDLDSEEVLVDGIVLTRADSVEPEDVEWLETLENQIAYGVMTSLVGMPGTNKTTWACRVAGKVTRDGRGVLMVSAEDSPSILRGRLQAAQADLGLCYFGSVRRNGYDGGLMLLPEDVANLESVISENNIGLLVFDPIGAHFGRDIDSNRDQSVRTALAPLAAMGIRNHCATLNIMHLNKGLSRDPFTRSGGSIGIPAISRVCLLMGQHPEAHPSENLRVLVGYKNNFGPPAQAEVYRLSLAAVENYHDPQITLEWQKKDRFTPGWVLGGGKNET